MESQPNTATPKLNQQPSQESRVPPISSDTGKGLLGNMGEEEDTGGGGWDDEDWGDIDVSLAQRVIMLVGFCFVLFVFFNTKKGERGITED